MNPAISLRLSQDLDFYFVHYAQEMTAVFLRLLEETYSALGIPASEEMLNLDEMVSDRLDGDVISEIFEEFFAGEKIKLSEKMHQQEERIYQLQKDKDHLNKEMDDIKSRIVEDLGSFEEGETPKHLGALPTQGGPPRKGSRPRVEDRKHDSESYESEEEDKASQSSYKGAPEAETSAPTARVSIPSVGTTTEEKKRSSVIVEKRRVARTYTMRSERSMELEDQRKRIKEIEEELKSKQIEIDALQMQQTDNNEALANKVVELEERLEESKERHRKELQALQEEFGSELRELEQKYATREGELKSQIETEKNEELERELRMRELGITSKIAEMEQELARERAKAEKQHERVEELKKKLEVQGKNMSAVEILRESRGTFLLVFEKNAQFERI